MLARLKHMTATRRLLARAALIAAGLILAGCNSVGVGGSYGSSSGFSRVGVGLSSGYYDYGHYPGYGYYPGPYFLAGPRHHHPHSLHVRQPHRHDRADQRRHDRRADSVRVGARDWRQGDGELRRDLRRRDGTPLAERQRLGRQERIREQRQDRADTQRFARSRGIVIEGTEPRDFGEPIDTGAARRQDRATQAERANQRRALQVRQEMLARRRALRGATSGN